MQTGACPGGPAGPADLETCEARVHTQGEQRHVVEMQPEHVGSGGPWAASPALGLHPVICGPVSALGHREGIFHVGVSFLLPGQKVEVRVPSLLLLFFQYLWLKIILEPKWHILG